MRDLDQLLIHHSSSDPHNGVVSDRGYMEMAARLALRGRGGAEPNPLVGCVIVSGDGRVVGWGYHRRCGEDHAEVAALRRAGARARGATAYVTLEPCNHHGRTGPCSEALIEAGVARVAFARADPTPGSAGGAGRLREAGVEVEQVDDVPAAAAVSDPYVHRIRRGLPWVTAKWAQTLDGCIANRAGESKWISNEASRNLVHLERGRTDAIMTGIGTVRADDPLLTARGRRRRRVARRVIVDPRLEIPVTSRLVATAREVPTIVACRTDALTRATALRDAGVDVIGVQGDGAELPMAPLLRDLVTRYGVAGVLVESGPGLLSRLVREGLVNEAWVFVAPRLMGDGIRAVALGESVQLTLHQLRHRRGDVILRYGVSPKSVRESGG